MTTEVWRPIPGYKGFYSVSSAGRVRSEKRLVVDSIGRPRRIKERILRPRADKIGYVKVALHKNGVGDSILIHRLVVSAFIGPCPIGREVNHRDGDKTNNHLNNLEYVTRRENIQHSFSSGLKIPQKGQEHGRSKLTEALVQSIKRQKGTRTARSIARDFGVHEVTIGGIFKGRIWKHVKVKTNKEKK